LDLDDPFLSALAVHNFDVDAQPGAVFDDGDLEPLVPPCLARGWRGGDAPLAARALLARIQRGRKELMSASSATRREHAITVSHPDVQAAVTYEENGEFIVAVVPKSYASAVDIREHLWKRHAFQALVVVVDELPTTADGAFDLAKLGEQVDSLNESQKSRFVAASGDLEKQLAELVGEILEIERVGALDDFIDMGGSSMHLIQLSTLIMDRFGADLSLEAVFEAGTVRNLAGLVQQRG
jgi:acyl carrier protein